MKKETSFNSLQVGNQLEISNVVSAPKMEKEMKRAKIDKSQYILGDVKMKSSQKKPEMTMTPLKSKPKERVLQSARDTKEPNKEGIAQPRRKKLNHVTNDISNRKLASTTRFDARTNSVGSRARVFGLY